MTRRASVEDPRDARIRELEGQVAQLVDALVKLATEGSDRPQYEPVPYPVPYPALPWWGGAIFIGDCPPSMQPFLQVTSNGTLPVLPDTTVTLTGYVS